MKQDQFFYCPVKSKIDHLFTRVLSSFLVITIFLTGCKKEMQPAWAESLNDLSGGPVQPLGSIPAYDFDWETSTYMPSLPNANPVPVPWNSGTTAIDPNLVADYKKSDGWELVWNTFGPDVQLNDPGYSYFFALYNRYRGLLRFYLWQGATPLATNFINHGLKLYGSQNSPLLNYNAQEMADVENNQIQFSQVLNQQLSLSGGSWIVFQYDIAYDPALAATSFPAFGLEWDSKWASVSQITLNGSSSGEIKGYVGNPNTSPFNFNSFLTKSVITLWGEQGYNSYLALLSGNGDNYFKSMLNAVNGVVKGFFNAVIGGSSTVPTPVNLTINTQIKLDGTITTNGGIINKKLVLPGQSNSQAADGNIPLYNSVMGLMTLSAAPTVYIDIVVVNEWFIDPWDNYYYQDQYYGYHTLDNNSFSITWNPAIINDSQTGATIQNLKIQIVKTNQPLNPYSLVGRFEPIEVGSVREISGENLVTKGYYEQIEDIGKLVAVSSFSNSTIPLVIIGVNDKFGIDTGVRISFDVVPNNGAPTSKVVKTFKAKTIKRY